jgi:hypothetical protein
MTIWIRFGERRAQLDSCPRDRRPLVLCEAAGGLRGAKAQARSGWC